MTTSRLVLAAPAFRYVAAAYIGSLAAYTLTPCRADGLAVGAMLALVARRPGGLARAAAWARVVAPAGVVAVAALAAWRRGLDYTDPVVSTAGMSLLAVSFEALLALVAAPPGGLAVTLRQPALVGLGRYN